MGLHPSSWTLVQQTNATILQLAQTGNVISGGPGRHGDREQAEERLPRPSGGIPREENNAGGQQVYGLDRKAAINFIKKKDEGRKRYLKDNFDADVDNPLLYHMIINTDLVQYDEAARLIGDEVIARFDLAGRAKSESSENRAIH